MATIDLGNAGLLQDTSQRDLSWPAGRPAPAQRHRTYWLFEMVEDWSVAVTGWQAGAISSPAHTAHRALVNQIGARPFCSGFGDIPVARPSVLAWRATERLLIFQKCARCAETPLHAETRRIGARI